MTLSRRIDRLLLLGLFCCVSCARHPETSTRSTAPPAAPPVTTMLFREAAAETGLNFYHFNGATGEKFFPEMVGPGVALIDYDNDGYPDIFVVQGQLLNPHKQMRDAVFPPPKDWVPGCRLYHNDMARTGTLHFTDVTEKAGLSHLKVGYGMGVTVGDYDNDGYPDMYVTGFGHSVLLHNNGNGTFTDVTAQAGVGDDGFWATSAAFVDYDRDGRLDLVVANYVDFTLATNKPCYSPSGEPDYCGPHAYHGQPARLYHNLGHGRFQDVTGSSGLGTRSGAGLGVACLDLNDHGWPDILIANDGAANHLWINQHNGRFKENAVSAGMAYNLAGQAQANMGIAVGDIDNRGRDDILITHLNQEGAALYYNDGNGLFHDAAMQYGLYQPTFTYTGFGAEFFDYDNDGNLDLFIANGEVRVVEKLRTEHYPFAQRNLLLHNEGAGRFRDVTEEAGAALLQAEVHRGVAIGDLDNDGDQDLVISNNNGPLRLLLNQVGKRKHWLMVRLQGVKSNRMGLGARVAVVRRGQPTLWRRCHTDGSYLSASDSRVHFGLGDSSTADAVVVQWPNGRQERWEGIKGDAIVTLREGTGKAVEPFESSSATAGNR